MDSMINHYTANRKRRNDDAYSPGGRIGLRPDRPTNVYSQRCREAFAGVPVIAGGVEASLRRIAHYDYWSDKVRPSMLISSKADLVAYGMGERVIVDICRRLQAGETVKDLRDMRGVAYVLGKTDELPTHRWADAPTTAATIELPALEDVEDGGMPFARMTKLLHDETSPLNGRRLTAAPRRPHRRHQPAVAAARRGRHGPHLRPALHAPRAPALRRATRCRRTA
jgi:uncharacterized radical SAM protein YgiQ